MEEYSLLDDRVKLLMLSVKSWAKKNGLGSAADGTLSSYTWLNLVIFYLQCIGFVPNLQSPAVMKAHGLTPDPAQNRKHGIAGFDTAFISSADVRRRRTWIRPDELRDLSVTALLFGFFVFYSDVFPRHVSAVSVRLGGIVLLKTVFPKSRLWRLCVEDPFESHDSRRPHDLGVHLVDTGQEAIESNLRRAAESMRLWFSADAAAAATTAPTKDRGGDVVSSMTALLTGSAAERGEGNQKLGHRNVQHKKVQGRNERKSGYKRHQDDRSDNRPKKASRNTGNRAIQEKGGTGNRVGRHRKDKEGEIRKE